jgi:tetratricopeptide (TPR) repeat protein
LGVGDDPAILQLMRRIPSFRSLCLSLALIASASHSVAQSEPGYEEFIQQGNAQLQAGSTDQALNSGEMAIKIGADRWEGYALKGSALMNLKRYEDAADALSKAIERAPDSKQPSLRDLRRRCLLAESGYPAVANSSASDSTHPATAQLEDDRQHLVAKLTWTDPATGLMWARYSRHAEYAHASFTRATRYCSALRSLGYTDWRLPTAVELMGIYRFAADSAKVTFEGGLAPNEEILRFLGFWTSTPGDKQGEHVLVFEGKSVTWRDDDGEGRVGGWYSGHSWTGAFVCVRDPKTAEHP